MKFKVGDKVRYKRSVIVDAYTSNDHLYNYALFAFNIVCVGNDQVQSEEWHFFNIKDLELVPEEPEFEFGEEIEVRDEIGGERKRVIFLCKTTENDTHQYITADISKKSFDNGARFHNNAWRFARKARPQLSRKKIAEKFWVSEDFILID